MPLIVMVDLNRLFLPCQKGLTSYPIPRSRLFPNLRTGHYLVGHPILFSRTGADVVASLCMYFSSVSAGARGHCASLHDAGI